MYSLSEDYEAVSLIYPQSTLKKIWKERPSHVVKAKIDSFCIHHGSFHSLKAGRYLNDEVSAYVYLFVYLPVMLCL